MMPVPIQSGELLEAYLTRSMQHAREHATPVELVFKGVRFVVTPQMSLLDAAAACGRAQRSHDLGSAGRAEQISL
jgi:hypothetical protein